MQRQFPLDLEHVACNLCGAQDARVLFDRPYRITSMAEGAACAATTDEFQDYGTIVRCRRCDLVYTSPRPAPGQLADGYADCVDETYLSESSSRSINAYLSLNTIKRHVKSGRLLEVGASIGYFLNAARVDFDVVGVEPSRWACGIARDRFKLDVRQGFFGKDVALENDSFDAVAMLDVIEHVDDPRATLRAARNVLKKGGVLYLVTPNIDSASAFVLRGYWWGLRPAHIYYFSTQTLAQLLDEEGFELLTMKSFGRIFSYGYWASRLKHYPAFIDWTARALIRFFDIDDKFLYLNLRDSVELCARKR